MDPSEARRAEKASRSEVVVNGFEAVAREWHATIHLAQVSAGHAARTLIRLEQDMFPWLGGLPVGEIKAPQLLQTMRRIEARGAIETAHRALQACGQVFRYAIATGRAERDPTPDLRGALKPVLVRHMAAITDPKRVGDLLRAIESYEGMPITRAALQLAPLVFVRPGELRKAEWDEFDLDVARWHIPAARMKRTKQGEAERHSARCSVVPTGSCDSEGAAATDRTWPLSVPEPAHRRTADERQRRALGLATHGLPQRRDDEPRIPSDGAHAAGRKIEC